MKYALMHRNGCGGPCWFMDEKPQPGALKIKGCRYPDGTFPLVGDIAKCGTCGAPAPISLDFVVEVIELEIPLLLPSLNAMGGAGRGHWTAWQKEKKLWSDWVLVAKHNQAKLFGQPKHERARVEIDRHCVQDVKDADNLRAGTKWLLDAIVGHGILKDDSKANIGEPEIRQIRCRRTDQPRTVVRIYPEGSRTHSPGQSAEPGS
jgi:hypothetical protein